eukprot:TRINITY_DN130_c0_g1_i4.p1 TRINITY_DN130_c0_g1~~TRINITY_DN130_c0_g1_i4.p1  ORF type:complete len:120 (-),score=8.55 TRINITY_DN130_c0_g1_i4:254-613(-)
MLVFFKPCPLACAFPPPPMCLRPRGPESSHLVPPPPRIHMHTHTPHRACTRVGKTVLHLDPNGYYGSEWASFNLASFQEWAEQTSRPPAAVTASDTDAMNCSSQVENYELQGMWEPQGN